MKSRMYIVKWVLVIALLQAPIVEVSAQKKNTATRPTPSKKKTAIPPKLQKLVRQIHHKSQVFFLRGGFPALSVGIVMGDHLVYTHHMGHYNLKTKKKPNNKTIYRMASINKVFTAALMQSMKEAGLVRLDDRLQSFMPKNVKVPTDPRGQAHITLRHLVTHTSGLPRLPINLLPKKGDPYANYPTKDLLTGLNHTQLLSPIGLKHNYSNLGFALLGYALGHIAKSTYAKELTKRILKPLGMVDTSLQPAKKDSHRVAVGYQKLNTKKKATLWHFGAMAPMGGLYSTLADMAKFVSLQFRASQKGIRPLSGGSLHQMHTVHRLISWSDNGNFDGGVGFGWHIYSLKGGRGKIVWHNGGVAGFRSFVGFSPRYKLGVILFTNCGRSPDPLGRSILESMTKLLWIPPKYTIDPRFSKLAPLLQAAIVAKPPQATLHSFHPLFLQKLSPKRIMGIFTFLHKKFGKAKGVKLFPSRHKRFARIRFLFARNQYYDCLVGIDGSAQGRIVYIRFLPPKKNKPKRK